MKITKEQLNIILESVGIQNPYAEAEYSAFDRSAGKMVKVDNSKTIFDVIHADKYLDTYKRVFKTDTLEDNSVEYTGPKFTVTFDLEEAEDRALIEKDKNTKNEWKEFLLEIFGGKFTGVKWDEYLYSGSAISDELSFYASKRMIMELRQFHNREGKDRYESFDLKRLNTFVLRTEVDEGDIPGLRFTIKFDDNEFIKLSK